MNAGTNRELHHPPAGLVAKAVLINKADLVAYPRYPFVLFIPQNQNVKQDSCRMPPENQVPRRSSATPRLEGQPNRRDNTSQLITFVDSQDPNSRSAIQRHTAHHSNAQRRDARLRSLRSNRPRLLAWQRRLSTETDTVSNTSPQHSTTSTSPSPVPSMRANLSAPSSISTEVTKADALTSVRAKVPSSSEQEADQPTEDAVLSDAIIGNFIDCFCPLTNKDNVQKVINYIRQGDVSSRALLLAIMLFKIGPTPLDEQGETKTDEIQQLYGKATRLLHARLTTPETASSDENIQAVLLLIAYASDTGSESEVHIHTEALSRMVQERGGLAVLASQIDSALTMQVQMISRSRRLHLTLACQSSCLDEPRFPNDNGLLDSESS